MAFLCFVAFGLILLSFFAVFAWRRHQAKKAGFTLPGTGQGATSSGASGLDKRFWLDVALYVGGFLLMFSLFFGEALAIYFGYGDLT